MFREFLHGYKRLARRKELVIVSAVLVIIILIIHFVSFKDYDQTIDSIKGNLPDLDKLKDKLPDLPDIPDIDFPFFGNEDKSETFSSKQQLFSKLFQIINEADPKIPRLDTYKTDQRVKNIRFDEETDLVFTKEYLQGFLDVKPEEVEALQKSHSQVVANFPKHANQLYKGEGIVYVGGGKFNWLSLMSIRTLRNIGSTLPVEVLIPTNEDYEQELCEIVLPSMNAKCLLLPDVLGEETMNKFEIGGFQYKALAILVSSFETVLLLDADNIPAYIPDHIFHQDPLKSKGLVIWPDFWRRATSLDYYKIANITVDENTRVMNGVTEKEKLQTDIPFHHFKGAIPDPTSESGQVLINKTMHLDTMFLSLYYNIYGPLYYYPLLSQGGLGQGDKETFLSAAVASNKPFYQMHENLVALGRHDDEGNFHGVGMGQFDPVQDFNKHETGQDDGTDPRILFIHANFPKLDPVKLENEKTMFDNDKRVRMYGPNMASRIGYDFEMFQWNNMHYLLCESHLNLKLFEKENITQVCANIQVHQDFLKSTM